MIDCSSTVTVICLYYVYMSLVCQLPVYAIRFLRDKGWYSPRSDRTRRTGFVAGLALWLHLIILFGHRPPIPIRCFSLSLSRPHGELLRRPAVDFVNDDDDDDDADADENA